MARLSFLTAGRNTSTIDVKISNRIIELFSEGLYSSPNKAIEELVSNSFDAGATHVHVILAPDLSARDATIVVIDDGEGMDAGGFEQHWIIGTSNKRNPDYIPPKGRRQIGKFGIGKLATYVLANRLTHVSKRGQGYYAITMDYSKVPTADQSGVFSKEPLTLNLRKLTEVEAQAVLAQWIGGDKPGYVALKLFGRGASKSWTVAILSSLKTMATEIRRGRLEWVLSSAMPLRDDFKLFLNGIPIVSSKLRQKKVGRWTLGQQLSDLPKPASDEGEPSEDPTEDSKSPRRYGLTYPSLGRVSGYIEVYRDPIDEGKSEQIERSNGFFVYVRDRMINVDDPGFGIDRNKLRHGTFSRFRMVLYADALDEELRSSRETLRAGPLFNAARNLAIGGFNYARARLQEEEQRGTIGSQVALRVEASPAALTRRPLAALVSSAFTGQYAPRYVTIPDGLSAEQQEELVESLRTEEEGGGSTLVQDTSLVTELSQDQPLAVFDVRRGILQINTAHPFVAYFLDEFEDKKQSLPLELLAMSEILLEAQLYQAGIGHTQIRETLDRRDQLLRHLARSVGKRNARIVAQALLDASSDQDALEVELVASFDSMGFEAVRMSGKGRADGRAAAYLSAKDGQRQGYVVSLEAKSKEKIGAKVAAKSVGISTIARHCRASNCDHAVVVGPDFPTTKGQAAALSEDIKDYRERNPDKTITLIRIIDLARLVRLVPLKRIGLDRLRELFIACSLPEEAKAWIDNIETEKAVRAPYRQILEIIHSEQRKSDEEVVEFGIVRSKLRDEYDINMKQDDVIEACRSLARIVPQWVTTYQSSVELRMRPDKILAAVQAAGRDW